MGVLALAGSLTAQTTWHVASGAAAPGTGTVASPFPSVQAALVTATTGDTILVSPGTYAETLDFLGKDVVLRGIAGPAVTIVDAQGGFHAVSFVGGETAAAQLVGFTLRNGMAIDGGGVLCVGASPSIRDCILTANQATNDGGGVHCFGASPTLERCWLLGGTAGRGGGLSAVSGSAPRLLDCVLSGNHAQLGGGVLVDAATIELFDCRIEHNTATGDGGGAQVVTGATATFDRALLRRNVGDFGGGLGLASGTAIVRSSRIEQNTARFTGGGISAAFSTLDLASSVVAANDAMVTGGGVFTNASTVTIRGCTLSRNSASTPAGALHVATLPAPQVIGSIFWGDVPGEIVVDPGANAVVTNSDVQGGFAGAGNFAADPQFVDPLGLDFHLGGGSPCLDAGGTGSGAPLTDLDGNPRILGPAMDAGADERSPELAGTPDDLLLESSINGLAGVLASRPVLAGDALQLRLTSPGGQLVGAVPAIAASLFATGSPPPQVPGLPEIHIDLTSFVFLVDGTAPPPFHVLSLTSAGVTFAAPIPPALGGMTLRVQGVAFGAAALNQSHAATPALDLVVP